MERIKYITNRDLLAEIHASKTTFCHFDSPEFSRFDAIVQSADDITPELIEQTRAARAKKLSTKLAPVLAASIDPDTLVYRVVEWSHVPIDPTGKRRPRIPGEEGNVRVNYPPFIHVVIKDGEAKEVGRSHWKGSLEDGEFSLEHGRITNRLAQMFMLLVDRYSRRGNWRGYTYVDEMRSHALLHLSQTGLQFDESKSDNPFAFYTTVIRHCFTRVLNLERRNQHIRDDLLIMAGVNPSFTRQIDHEMSERESELQNGGKTVPLATPAPAPAKKPRGRKPKEVKDAMNPFRSHLLRD